MAIDLAIENPAGVEYSRAGAVAGQVAGTKCRKLCSVRVCRLCRKVSKCIYIIHTRIVCTFAHSVQRRHDQVDDGDVGEDGGRRVEVAVRVLLVAAAVEPRHAVAVGLPERRDEDQSLLERRLRRLARRAPGFGFAEFSSQRTFETDPCVIVTVMPPCASKAASISKGLDESMPPAELCSEYFDWSSFPQSTWQPHWLQSSSLYCGGCSLSVCSVVAIAFVFLRTGRSRGSHPGQTASARRSSRRRRRNRRRACPPSTGRRCGRSRRSTR